MNRPHGRDGGTIQAGRGAWHMILLFTDFGVDGPYIGQIQLAIYRTAPNLPVTNLMADAPRFRPLESSYLLAALAHGAPGGSVFLGVVDPGVGSDRLPIVLRAEGYWYVGPDNGLFDVVAASAKSPQWWQIVWHPARLTSSFHGRDLFAPTAARLAMGMTPEAAGCEAVSRPDPDVAQELARVIYVDGFGNVLTGLKAAKLAPDAVLSAGGQTLRRANTFSDVAPGEAFWYANSNGLAEIAVNQGRADTALGLGVGDEVLVDAASRLQ